MIKNRRGKTMFIRRLLGVVLMLALIVGIVLAYFGFMDRMIVNSMSSNLGSAALVLGAVFVYLVGIILALWLVWPEGMMKPRQSIT
jgi:hypothetical protein